MRRWAIWHEKKANKKWTLILRHSSFYPPLVPHLLTWLFKWLSKTKIVSQTFKDQKKKTPLFIFVGVCHCKHWLPFLLSPHIPWNRFPSYPSNKFACTLWISFSQCSLPTASTPPQPTSSMVQPESVPMPTTPPKTTPWRRRSRAKFWWVEKPA